MPGSGFEIIDKLDAQAEHHKTPCGDGVLRWRVWGTGKPLIFFHGGFGSWMHWIRNIEPMSERYRVIAVDLPGLGESQSPPEPETPRALGAILADGLGELLAPNERAHLVGFSFGGLLSGQVAARLGDQIQTLTLAGASGLGLNRRPLELIRRTPEMSAQEVEDAVVENALRLMIYDRANCDDLARYILSNNDANARLRSRKHSLGTSLRDVLPQVPARINGIWGEHDVTAVGFMQERVELFQSLDAECDFRIVPQGGHWVMYETADGFNSNLIEILNRYD